MYTGPCRIFQVKKCFLLFILTRLADYSFGLAFIQELSLASIAIRCIPGYMAGLQMIKPWNLPFKQNSAVVQIPHFFFPLWKLNSNLFKFFSQLSLPCNCARQYWADLILPCNCAWQCRSVLNITLQLCAAILGRLNITMQLCAAILGTLNITLQLCAAILGVLNITLHLSTAMYCHTSYLH